MIPPRVISGFTLIELVLYVALVSIILTMTTLFAVHLSQSVDRVDSRQDDQTQLLFALERITREIQNSLGVDKNQSQFGINPSRLAILNNAGGTDFIELSQIGGAIRIRRAGGAMDVLTTPDVEIGTLIFTNLSQAKRSGIIHIRVISSDINKAFETAVTFRELLQI